MVWCMYSAKLSSKPFDSITSLGLDNLLLFERKIEGVALTSKMLALIDSCFEMTVFRGDCRFEDAKVLTAVNSSQRVET